MPSPFPGMDPFLEEPARWGGVHSRLINSISDYLADRVSPDFFVEIEERVYIVTPDDGRRQSIVPDVYVVSGQREEPPGAMAGVITTPTLIEPLYDVEIRDRYIEIRDTINRQVVTTIEALSPYNKARGTQGREAFLRKRKVSSQNVGANPCGRPAGQAQGLPLPQVIEKIQGSRLRS